MFGARSSIRSLFVLGFAVFLSGGAAAQIPTSSADVFVRPGTPPRSDLVNSDRVFRDLVACVVRRQAARTRNLLDTIPGSQDESRILFSFDSRMESCFDYFRAGTGAMSYPSNVLRGIIAEVFYGREFPEGIAPAGEAQAAAANAWTEPRLVDGQATQAELLHSMARCVTVRQPAAVAALLRTTPVSDAEQAAMRRLQGDLAACLYSGVELTASPQALRGLFAEAALHYGEARRTTFARVGRELAGRE